MRAARGCTREREPFSRPRVQRENCACLAGLRGVVFYDAGNVFSEKENFFQSSQRGGTLPLGLFHSTGFGLRWFSPLGPLRFEVGFPLTRRPIDDSYLFEFTIGNFF